MKITYESTLDDMVEPHLRLYLRSKTYQRSRWTTAISASLITIVFFWVLFRPESTLTILLSVLGGVASALISYVLTFKAGVKKRIRKYVEREVKDKPPALSEYSVGDGKITFTTRNVSLSFLLADLVSITEDTERIELFFGDDKGICLIPLRVFHSPEEKSLFMSSLRPTPTLPQ
jgi:hypothetical protein